MFRPASTAYKIPTPAERLVTPDGRYIVVRGRLWRASNPALASDVRQALVDQLMTARRAVALARKRGDGPGEAAAHAQVDAAKRGLGERGPVWWTDGAADFNRHMAHYTPYADWYAAQDKESGRYS
jgi:hypothetical protein